MSQPVAAGLGSHHNEPHGSHGANIGDGANRPKGSGNAGSKSKRDGEPEMTYS